MPANVETMSYQGHEVPWHGLGNPVNPDVSVERMLIEAGLEWQVGVSPVHFQANNQWFRDSKRRVMFREDTNMVLDVVGPNYIPIQNEQVMEFFREYVEAGDARLETAGSLNSGKQIWALAKLNDGFSVGGEDKVLPYVLLMNPHQYGKGMIVKFTTVRVVCSNTMTIALTGQGQSLKLWHNREFDEKTRQEAKRRLGIARERLEVFQERVEQLAQVEVSIETAIKILAPYFKGDDKELIIEKQPPTLRRIVSLYEGQGMGSNMATAQGTAWGLLNGVTQYLDHEYGKTVDARMTYVWLGNGEVIKRGVMNDLIALSA